VHSASSVAQTVAGGDATAFQGIQVADRFAVWADGYFEMEIVDGPDELAVGVVDPAADQLGGSHVPFPGIRPMTFVSTHRRNR
jgi:hypothetical protein